MELFKIFKYIIPTPTWTKDYLYSSDLVLTEDSSSDTEICCNNTYWAAYRGHLECIKNLRSQGKKWHEYTAFAATEGGHLEILKYVFESGCPLDIHVIPHALINEKIEILNYAIANGCKWSSSSSLYDLAYLNKLDSLIYCLENDCPWSWNKEILHIIYEYQRNKNLITNTSFRKILLHPKLKKEVNYKKCSKFVKEIKEYEEYITKVSTLLKSETNLPIDVIKYEILKYL